MFRTATLSAILLAAAPLAAQPVLQASDLPSSPVTTGLSIISAGAAAGANGANQTWNLTGATVLPIGTAVWSTATGTPYAAQVPTANRALAWNVTGSPAFYSYFRSTSNLLELLADGIPDPEADIYTNGLQLLQFPMSFNQSFTDSYAIQGGVSGSVTWTYTGYGTVQTTAGTYSNVAKLTSSDGELAFWLKTPLRPLLLLDDEGDGTFFPAGAVTVEETSDAVTLRIFPNPANEAINLNGAQPGDHYTLIDALGRVLTDGVVPVSGTMTLDVRDLDHGRYYLRLANGTSVATLPFHKD
jgi:hypothetical protein